MFYTNDGVVVIGVDIYINDQTDEIGFHTGVDWHVFLDFSHWEVQIVT